MSRTNDITPLGSLKIAEIIVSGAILASTEITDNTAEILNPYVVRMANPAYSAGGVSTPRASERSADLAISFMISTRFSASAKAGMLPRRPRRGHIFAMRNPGAKDVLVSEILVIFAITLVAARLNLRLRIQKRRLLQSDKWMIAACVSGVLTAGFVPVFAYLNAFDPKVHTTLEGYSGGTEDLTVILKLLFAINFPFYTTLYLCKAALLAVYQQAFPNFMVKRRIFLWMTIWFVALSYVATVLVAFCVCLPIERHWHVGLSTTCSPGTYVITFNVGWVLSFVGDLLVFILPWLIVPGLQVKRTLRLGIYFTFLLGSVNMAVSLVRFVMIFEAAADSTISLSTIILWSALDVNIGLVIACLPSLRPYFGSRGKSQDNSHNIEAGSSLKSWKHGARAVHRHGNQHGEEGLPTSFSAERLRELSVDCTIVVPWDEGKGHVTDARDIELEHNEPPKAYIPRERRETIEE
ncbi:integral membrane protein [Fusarium heterosporum]|uniref:Integral membrane protein n=1 Tax=Fusarium heterosporum TaxID=42747 RepID=A0A8H5WJ85_FUSHE|nr:integral membrane protein [Fusarium heterosporum]